MHDSVHVIPDSVYVEKFDPGMVLNWLLIEHDCQEFVQKLPTNYYVKFEPDGSARLTQKIDVDGTLYLMQIKHYPNGSQSKKEILNDAYVLSQQ